MCIEFKLGSLKQNVLNAKEEDFAITSQDANNLSIEIEDYYGNTIQGFLLSTNKDEIEVKDVYTNQDNISIELEDYGVKTSFEDKSIVIKYLKNILDVADITIDSMFENASFDEELTCIRLQVSRLNLYEVVVGRTETRAGSIFIEATNREEAEDIIEKDIENHLSLLKKHGELPIVEEIIESCDVYMPNMSNAELKYKVNGIVYNPKDDKYLEIKNGEILEDVKKVDNDININPNREFLLNHLQELQADFEDFNDDELIENRDVMLHRINECLRGIFEGDNI